MTPEEIKEAFDSALAPFQEELRKRLTIEEARAMIEVEMRPIKAEVSELHRLLPQLNTKIEQVLSGQDAHHQIQIEVARLAGAVSTLSTLKSTEIESLRAADNNLLLAINTMSNTLAASLGAIADIKGTLFGFTDRPQDDDPVMKRLSDLADQGTFHRTTLQQLKDGIAEQLDTHFSELQEVIVADHAWIERRRNLERKFAIRAKAALGAFFAWVAKTTIGKIVFGSGVISAVIAFLATNPIGQEIVRWWNETVNHIPPSP